MNEPDQKSCMNSALRILSHRDHSTCELAAKLNQRGYGRQEIQRVLSECRRLHYLDDHRFAVTRLRYLRRKGYGPHRIRQFLESKGVEPGIIVEAMEAKYSEEQQLIDCRNALAKKIDRARDKSLRGQKARLYRFLSQRGFPSAVIRSVLDEQKIL